MIFGLQHKAQATPPTTDKTNDIKLNSFYKQRINRVKRQPREWMKIFASHIQNKEGTSTTQ